MAELSANELVGTKWNILEIISTKPSYPKKIADELGTTIANISQQLKLLEAYGYVKSQRVDKGVGSRKKRKSRILYQLNKNQLAITSINPFNIKKQEIKQNSLNTYLANILLYDLKNEAEVLLYFYTNYQNLFDMVDAFFLLKTDSEEVHLLVITEKLEEFRGEKSKLQIKEGKISGGIRFWSHTIEEVRRGLEQKEKYFVDQMNLARPLYEKKTNYTKKLWEEQNE